MSLGRQLRWYATAGTWHTWVFWIALLWLAGFLIAAVWNWFSPGLDYDDSAHRARYLACVDAVVLETDAIVEGLSIEQIRQTCLDMTRRQ